ncbi:hypothetical protein C2I36_15945 [Rhodobacteraceae bacterium WD3A24]|nr:hypothetical protein C2I36_15945 [Rhodobacteraceae bacterium WD3A24]
MHTFPRHLALAAAIALAAPAAGQAPPAEGFTACEEFGTLADLALLDTDGAPPMEIATICARAPLPDRGDDSMPRALGQIEIWRLDGAAPARATVLETRRQPRRAAPGDIDADGDTDLAVVAQAEGGRGVTLFPGDGAGGFEADPVMHRMRGAQAQAVIFHDSAHTDLVDLILTGPEFTWGGLVLTNRGPEAFDRFSEALLTPDHETPPTAVTEMSGDTQPDLAVTLYSRGRIDLYAGGLDDRLSVPLGKDVRSVARVLGGGDLNGDWMPDLAVAMRGEQAPVRVALSQGGENWALTEALPGAAGAHSAHVGDFDHDGARELLLVTDSRTARRYAVGEQIEALGTRALPAAADIARSGDMRGDGRSVLVTGATETGRVQIHRWGERPEDG